MKFPISLLAAAAMLLPFAAAAAEPHHNHGGAHHELQLNQGKQWATDAALRKGMNSIRASISASMHKAHAGKMTPAAYDALGNELSTQVNYIIQNCKLTPAADAQLHVILAEMLQGIETINGKGQDQDRAHGVLKVAAGLNRYGQYFDHPGFRPVKTAH